MFSPEGPQPRDPHIHIGSAACEEPAARVSLHVAPLALQLLVESLSAASSWAADAGADLGSLESCRACLYLVLVAGRWLEAVG